ncbi:MAG: hypothetical protein AAF468_08855 [Pseudomonadota bacterium]
MTDNLKTPAPLRVMALALDLITVTAVSFWCLACTTGKQTDHGMEFQGMPVLMLVIALLAYFVVGTKIVGGTIWQRILRIK